MPPPGRDRAVMRQAGADLHPHPRAPQRESCAPCPTRATPPPGRAPPACPPPESGPSYARIRTEPEPPPQLWAHGTPAAGSWGQQAATACKNHVRCRPAATVRYRDGGSDSGPQPAGRGPARSRTCPSLGDCAVSCQCASVTVPFIFGELEKAGAPARVSLRAALTGQPGAAAGPAAANANQAAARSLPCEVLPVPPGPAASVSLSVTLRLRTGGPGRPPGTRRRAHRGTAAGPGQPQLRPGLPPWHCPGSLSAAATVPNNESLAAARRVSH